MSTFPTTPTQTKPSRPLSGETGRRSPFCRPDSALGSPTTSTVGMPRASTPTHSPSVSVSSLSPTKPASLSPEKTNPFTRRPSQLRHTPEPKQPASPFGRPSSPFARPTNLQNIPSSPSRPPPSALQYAPPSPSRPLPTGLHNTPSSPGRPLHPVVRNATNESGMFSRALRSTSGLFGGAPAESSTDSMASTPKAANNGPRLINTVGGYNHVPQPLLRSMRESFEVLDSSNSGSIDQSSLSSMLEQMGIDNSPASLQAFFPRGHETTKVNLARYLDSLSAPLAALSPPDELQAAFEAFDVDDSGQIDVAMLRQALLNTAPEPGEAPVRLSEREVDAVMSQFTGRRAFGSKGIQSAKTKGEIFRYREFMTNITGGNDNDGAQIDVGA